MNNSRVEEILNSSENIDVTYQGKSVWITTINTDQDTAMVQMPVGSNNKIEVPVGELIEKH